MLKARRLNGECQVLADRQSWLGNSFPMLNTADVTERQVVCDRHAAWRRAPHAAAARQIANQEGLRRPVPPQWLSLARLCYMLRRTSLRLGAIMCVGWNWYLNNCNTDISFCSAASATLRRPDSE